MTLLEDLFDKATEEKGLLRVVRFAASGLLDWVAGTPIELEAHYDSLAAKDDDDYIIGRGGYAGYHTGHLGGYSIEALACFYTLFHRGFEIPASILSADLVVRTVGRWQSAKRDSSKKAFRNMTGLIGYARLFKDYFSAKREAAEAEEDL